MKKYFGLMSLILLLSLTFIGCDDDDDGKDDNDKNGDEKLYFPLKMGHYRVYENYLEPSSEGGSATMTGMDSVVVTVASDNHNATVNKFSSSDGLDWGEAVSTDKYNDDDYITRVGGDGFYAQLQLIFGEDTKNIFADQQWYTIIDQNKNDWNIFSQSGLNLSATLSSFEIEITDVSIDAVNNGLEDLTLDNFTGKALKITTTTTLTYNLGTMTQEIENWYAEGIGTVLSNVAVPMAGDFPLTLFPASRSEILRHSTPVYDDDDY